MGGFIHVLGGKKDALTFMANHGIPGFVWHIPGKGFKALRTLYRKRMQSHIDSLLAGEQVSSVSKKQLKENAVKAVKVHSNVESVSTQSALSPCKRINVMSAAYPLN